MQHAREEVGISLAAHGADQVQAGELRHQVHGEFAAVPTVNRQRPDLARQEIANLSQAVLLFSGQELFEGEEVAVGVGKLGEIGCGGGHGYLLW